jgi:hypothetical protein
MASMRRSLAGSKLMDNQKLVARGMPGGGWVGLFGGQVGAPTTMRRLSRCFSEFAKLEKSFTPWYTDRVIGE